MRSLGQDIRFAVRMLGKSPGTTLAAVASLALGLGANAAIFSALNALLLRPLPVRAPGEVVAVFTSDYSGPALGMSSYPDYLDFRDNEAFASLAAYALQPVGLVAGDQSARLWAEVVTGNYFETVGVKAARGRLLTAHDDRAGAPGVAVVNETFARRYFPDRDALGQRISASGPEGPWLEIVGIVRDGKYATLGEDATPFFYLPLYQDWDFVRRSGAWAPLTLIARTNGEPLAAAAALRDALQSLDGALPVYGARAMTSHLGLVLLPARLAGAVLGLFGTVGLALASLGLAGVVAQAVSRRQREIGVRIALGANAGSVLRLVLAEGLRPVGMGLVLGLLLSAAAARLVASFLYGLSPLDPPTLVGVPALLLVVATLAAYLPARRATRVDPVLALRCE